MDTHLEKNQLPDFILADLYKNALVVLDEIQPRGKILQTAEKADSNQPKQAIEPIEELLQVPGKPIHQPQKLYLGDNKKQITILVRESNAVYLNEDSLSFLSTILGACKLNLGDVAIVNNQAKTYQYPFLKEQLAPIYLLLFDVTTYDINLPFTIPHYQVQHYDQCSFLSAPALQGMLGSSQEAKLEKSKLWLSLKKMFGI